jgi:hypothetical protein
MPTVHIAMALLLHGWLPAAGDVVDEVPLVGRPADLPFSGASGEFEVAARATPTTLQAERPLTFTVIVRSVGAARRPPDRLDLARLPAFAERFYFDAAGDETRHPDENTWEFEYRLKPRGPDVDVVPGLPFVYYNPAISSPSRAYQVRYTDPIPLRVRPAEEFRPLPAGPESLYHVNAGPELLARQSAAGGVGRLIFILMLLAPPTACLIWYLIWRRGHRHVVIRKAVPLSAEARRALRSLRGSRRLSPTGRADRCAEATVEYLRNKYGFGVAEATPAEAAQYLAGIGRSAEVAALAAAFFAKCDAVRFLPAAQSETSDLAAEASRLVSS